MTHIKSTKANITIAGAGPVGSMLAIILSRAGYQTDIYESRPDARTHDLYQGKSINITLSDRAWLALKAINLDEKVRSHAIPLNKRVIHLLDGSETAQNYGTENQKIWSISRKKINEILLTQACSESNTNFHFDQRLTHIDFNSGCCSFSYRKAGRSAHKEVDADYVFAADGAHSKVRRLAQDTPRFNYSQSYMKQCYIELTIPANPDGSYQLDSKALHLWPRKDLLLMALPNNDGSFTCTLFLNSQGDTSFDSLKSSTDIYNFFKQYFSCVLPLLSNPVEAFTEKTPNPLFLVSVDPWIINNKIALIGDAAHAMVPFYGQGLNCCFEDCYQLSQLITKHKGNWQQIFPDFQSLRKKNTDAISELSKDNFLDMSKLSYNSSVQLRRRIEEKFQQIHPDLWQSIYTMVNFRTDISYNEARTQGIKQARIMDEIMKIEGIEDTWQEAFIYEKLKGLVEK